MANSTMLSALEKFKAIGFEHIEELGQALLNASHRTIFVYRPVFDNNNTVIDFEIIIHNRNAASATHDSALVGKLFSKHFPSLVVEDMQSLMIDTYLNGTKHNIEKLYFNSEYKGYHNFNIVKLGAGVLVFSSNVTAQKEAEREIAESKETLQGILNAPNIGLAVCKAIRNAAGEIVDFIHEFTNRRTIETLGRDMTGHLLSEFGEGGFGQLPQFKQTIETNQLVTYTRKLTIRGITYDVLLSNAPLGNDRLVHVWEDLTQISKMQEELTELRLKQQKEILNAIILAQEQERERIGEALHNGVAQLLYGIKTRVDLIRTEDAEKQKILDDIQSVISDAISETRTISFELVPAVLKDHGLETAIRALFQRIGGTQIKFEFSCIKPKRLPEKMEYTLYRIIQEALSNIVKHSNASIAQVLIHQKRNLLHVEINDNGNGFNSAKIDPMSSGIGLQHMQQRVKLLDGLFKVRSSSAGTKIKIKIPYARENYFLLDSLDSK